MAASRISLIIPLVDAERNRRAGGKAINLSKLIAAHFDVPRGFVISADAHSFHLYSSGVRNIAASIESPESRQAAYSAVLDSEIPDDIWKGIADAYHRLGLQVGVAEPKVIVRPSIVEGSKCAPKRSIAGISGEEALKDAIRQVWARTWDTDASDDEIRLDEPGDMAAAVIVQHMIESEPKLTTWTIDTATGDPGRTVVEYGQARVTIDLRDMKIIERAGEPDNPLSDSIITGIAEQTVLAESVICSPIKIEWVHEGGRFWVIEAGEAGCDITVPDMPGQNWKRVSKSPVSQFARSLLWAADTDKSCSLISGYIYRTREQAPEPKDWQPQAEKVLEKWKKDNYTNLTDKASAIIQINLSAIEYQPLIELFAQAAEISRTGLDWIRTAQTTCELYLASLGQLVPESEITALLGGLQCPSFMRDARIQEMGDKLAAAQKSGLSADEEWGKRFQREVKLLAGEYGYSFLNSGEMADPACWKSWVEDTDTLFRIIGAAARRKGGPSLVTLHCAAGETAKLAEAKLMAGIKPAGKATCTKLLRGLRGWICAMDEGELVYALGCTALRLVAHELGRRLTESGVLSKVEDVFCLEPDELKNLPQEHTEEARSELVSKIAARKHEMWLEERLVTLAATESYSSSHNWVINPGSVSGRARIAESISETGELAAGDILVIDELAHGWTPMLGTAGGVICECDHISPACRFLATGYGVPVLTGCRGAMDSIQNGYRITLGGSGDLPYE